MMKGNLQPKIVFQRRVLICLGALILLLVGFGAGFYLRGFDRITQYLGFPVVSNWGSSQPSYTTSKLGSQVDEVRSLLSDEAYEPANDAAMASATLNALLKSSGDEYARYYTTEQYNSYISLANGEFGGIGVLLSEYDGRAYVVRVFDNTPAQEAGIIEGDFITSINGETRVSWSTEEIVERIGSEPGMQVELGWRRPQTRDDLGGEVFSATLVSAIVDIPNVQFYLDGAVGYISLSQFTRKSTNDVELAFRTLEEQGAQAYIIDVRGNPGGYLTQAVEIVSMFLHDGTVVQIDSRASGLTQLQVTNNFLTDKPLVVLVNENSASAAEIFAAALLDYDRATIIGTQTFGKGTVQAIKELSNGGAIKYTIARYLSPLGTEINDKGVTPNIVVEMEATLQGDKVTDTQYQAALTEAKQLLAQQAKLATE